MTQPPPLPSPCPGLPFAPALRTPRFPGLSRFRSCSPVGTPSSRPREEDRPPGRGAGSVSTLHMGAVLSLSMCYRIQKSVTVHISQWRKMGVRTLALWVGQARGWQDGREGQLWQGYRRVSPGRAPRAWEEPGGSHTLLPQERWKESWVLGRLASPPHPFPPPWAVPGCGRFPGLPGGESPQAGPDIPLRGRRPGRGGDRVSPHGSGAPGNKRGAW